jgi:signal transduction histidine kinase
VADDGPPFPADLTGGHGLTSVTERLTLLYGDRFEIRFDNGDGAGQMKHVHVTLPFDLPR